MARILVFGDSIAWGAWDFEGGWVQRLWRYALDRHCKTPEFYHSVYNLSVSGETTDGLLKRIEPEIKARRFKGDGLTVVVAMGKNDAAYSKSRGGFQVEPEKFLGNIRKIKKAAGKYAEGVIFVGLGPIIDTNLKPYPSDTDLSWDAKDVKKYHEILRDFCAKEGLHFIDFYAKAEAVRDRFLDDDGLHPSPEGHALIFKEALAFFERHKIW